MLRASESVRCSCVSIAARFEARRHSVSRRKPDASVGFVGVDLCLLLRQGESQFVSDVLLPLRAVALFASVLLVGALAAFVGQLQDPWLSVYMCLSVFGSSAVMALVCIPLCRDLVKRATGQRPSRREADSERRER